MAFAVQAFPLRSKPTKRWFQPPRKSTYTPLKSRKTHPACVLNSSTEPTQTPPKTSHLLYQCVQCRSELPVQLDGGKCAECGARYMRTAEYLDFEPDSRGREATSVRTFQSPLVAVLYERGWRANFVRAGFPGAAEEAAAARAHIGPDARLVLDASCGSGVLARELASYYDVIALDLSAAMLVEAARRDRGSTYTRVRADVARMPFKTGAFDGVVSGAALHCWPRLPDALREVRRVLRPGGAFYATTFQRDTLAKGAPRPIADIVHQLSVNAQFRYFWPEELVWQCKAAGFTSVDVQVRRSFITVRCT